MGRITHELHAQHLADFRYYILLYDIIIFRARPPPPPLFNPVAGNDRKIFINSGDSGVTASSAVQEVLHVSMAEP